MHLSDVTVGLEEWVGDDPVKGLSKYVYAFGTLAMAVVGGLTVALAAVMPLMGAAALVVFVPLFVLAQAAITRVRNRRAAKKGTDLIHGHVGAAHGLEQAGTVVRFLAKWRYVTIPVVIVGCKSGSAVPELNRRILLARTFIWISA